MGTENKTEQPTARRRQKAREKGQVARSRELPSSLSLLVCVVLIGSRAPAAIQLWRDLYRHLLTGSASASLHTGVLMQTLQCTALVTALPAFAALGVSAAASVFQGGLVFSPALLSPSMERISPASKFKQMFSLTSVVVVLKSLLPFAVIAYIAYQVYVREWNHVIRAAFEGITPFLSLMAGLIYGTAWKASLVLLLWAGMDYLFTRQKFERDLRMSRDEIREEAKETEGNPQVKARIRRIQRQARRCRMLQDVQKATVVITNPTHFAVALQYQQQMAAPVVVAKGCDTLAAQIREMALWHSIPLVEDRPLAQSLYRMVEVGQAIPGKLYVAVAEILAFVYRTRQATAPGGAH